MLFFFVCLGGNVYWIVAEGHGLPDVILETQEVENTSGVYIASTVVPMGPSVYYNTAKGWMFNDIVYIESCLKYDSAYGGPSTGMLDAGYYRFVKTNGSYVALCEVNLVADTIARNCYLELWNQHGGMWTWEQAFYNQLDGTPELSRPTDVKQVQLPNGKVVIDETRNFRFIKCWIKIEDLQPNPETQKKSYTQTVRYFKCDERTGKVYEVMNMRSQETVTEGKAYTISVKPVEGHRIKSITMNGDARGSTGFSYEVSSDNEVCLYYSPNKLTVQFKANGGIGNMSSQFCYYGEEMVLQSNSFFLPDGMFIGWGTSADSATISYTDQDRIRNTLTQGDQVITLYAIWDMAPEIVVQDLYFLKEYLLKVENLQDYILYFCRVTDGETDWGDQTEGTRITLHTDIRSEVENITEGWIRYKVGAVDSAGNQVYKWGRIYIISSVPHKVGLDDDKFRFIAPEYIYTLEEDSVWLLYEYFSDLLEACFQIETGEVWKKTEFGWQRI